MESLVKEGSICAVLFKSRIITEDDIRAALEEQKKSGCRIGEALVKLGIVAQEDIDWALSNQLNIPYVRLNKESIDKAAVDLVPARLAREFNMIPIYRSGDEIVIALADPLNKEAVEAVEKLTGCRVTVSMPIIRELRAMQDLFYGPAADEKSFGFSSPRFAESLLASVNKDLSGATFLNLMLHHIARNQLTSLSFQPMGDHIAVTGKRDEASRQIGRLSAACYPDLTQLIMSRGRMEDTKGVCAKGTLEFMYKGAKTLFHVHALKGKGGDYITLKMDANLPFPARIGEMGLSQGKVGMFRDLAAAREGILLFISASRDECCRIIDLYLDEADTANKTVMVLGDGPGRGEKRFPCIPFRKMLPAEVEAAAAAFLDHDPDIMVIEDVSEKRIFKMAARGAMAAKLVVCGLSSIDVGGAMEFLLRTRDEYPVLSYVRGIVSVKGVKLLCPRCKQEHLLSPGARKLLPAADPAAGYFAPHGCPDCNHTGYLGRKFLLEIIPFNEEIAALFATAGESGEILKFLKGSGHRDIPEEAAELLAQGEISPEEYLIADGRYDGKN